MSERTSAEEDLRVIRNLMERATIYRAISAPTALVGGLLALGTAATLGLIDHARPVQATALDRRWFAVSWLIVLALVLAANALFVRQEALRGGRPFLSSGARLALRAIAPCLVIPAATTIWFFRQPDPINEEILVAVWIAFYGLALLATALFAPRSLAFLGWAFLLGSLVVVAWPKPFSFDPRGLFPNLAMGATFGLFHLLYAAGTWSQRWPDASGPALSE